MKQLIIYYIAVLKRKGAINVLRTVFNVDV